MELTRFQPQMNTSTRLDDCQLVVGVQYFKKYKCLLVCAHLTYLPPFFVPSPFLSFLTYFLHSLISSSSLLPFFPLWPFLNLTAAGKSFKHPFFCCLASSVVHCSSSVFYPLDKNPLELYTDAYHRNIHLFYSCFCQSAIS